MFSDDIKNYMPGTQEAGFENSELSRGELSELQSLYSKADLTSHGICFADLIGLLRQVDIPVGEGLR
jgi:hypothetical protein